MAYRANVTDKQQAQIEEFNFDGGSPVFADGETRMIGKEARGGAMRVIGANSGVPANSSSGVVIPHDDQPTRIPSDTIGRP